MPSDCDPFFFALELLSSNRLLLHSLRFPPSRTWYILTTTVPPKDAVLNMDYDDANAADVQEIDLEGDEEELGEDELGEDELGEEGEEGEDGEEGEEDPHPLGYSDAELEVEGDLGEVYDQDAIQVHAYESTWFGSC